MPLTQEQVSQLKSQLREQIKKLPDDQRKEAEKQIDEMSDEAIEEMLEQQKKPQKPVYRAIVEGEIPSKKISEDKFSIAVLDIRPISKGHVIIIPKKPVKKSSEIPSQSFNLAKRISKKIIAKLKATGAEIQTQFQFDELIINIIPVYDKPISLNSPRTEAKEKELEEIKNLLETKPKKKIVKLSSAQKKTSNLPQLKRRIP